MRPIVIVLVAVALGIAGVTAMLVSRMVSTPAAPTAIIQPVAGPPTEDVLVAAVDIKPGVIVKAEDLRYIPWPTKNMDSRLIRRGAGDDPKTAFVGAIARRPLLAGEPLNAEAVFRQDEAGVLAGMLSPGMRAVTIPVTAVTGVAGFVLPHDHVDIILNQDVNAISGRSGGPARSDLVRFASEIILSDVRVLAIDDKLAKTDAAATVTGKTVTVEVSPKDAEILLTASKMGELMLALRSPAPTEAGNTVSGTYTSDVEVSRALQAVVGGRGPVSSPVATTGSRAIRVNRGGSTLMQSFSN